MLLFKHLPVEQEAPATLRGDDLKTVGQMLTAAFTKPADEVWGSFNSEVADLLAKLDVESIKA